MQLTKDCLQQLLRLQELDTAGDALQASIDRIPVEIQAKRDALESEKARLKALKDASTKLQLAKKEKELSLGQKEEAIRKHGQELNQVKSNEAYKALLAEIEKAKAEAGELETAILMLMDEIDRAARDGRTQAQAFKGAEAEAQREIQALESRRAELESKASAERSKRGAAADGAPAEVMKLYDYLRRRKQGMALSPVKNGICGACRITILPQSLVELARGVTLVACESCQRILYYQSEAFLQAGPAEPIPARESAP